jgi:SAM-dependent methyltransferase
MSLRAPGSHFWVGISGDSRSGVGANLDRHSPLHKRCKQSPNYSKTRLRKKRNAMPDFAGAASMDNCNFTTSTTWSHGETGRTFRYLPDAEPGMQCIHDAIDLASIPDGSYEFLLASHIPEHVANPLRALEEFHRVLKPKGFMLITVPDRLHTFDHRRTVAPRPRSTRTEWQAAAGELDAERAATLWNYGGIERTLRGKRGLGMMAAACTEEADCYAPWGAKCYLSGLG